MTTTLFVVIFMLAVPLAWELYTLTPVNLHQISDVFRALGREWNPFIMYVVSILPGHFWVTPPYTIAQYLDERAELAVVLIIGWVIFWAFRSNPGLMPLDWFDSLVLILFSVAVGAFLWTMGA